jgi:hypothetical protein
MAQKRKVKNQATAPKVKRRAISRKVAVPLVEPCPHTWVVIKTKNLTKNDDKNCEICKEPLTYEEQQGERIVRLPCRHVYCESGITKWRERSLYCPYCRDEQPLQIDNCDSCKAFLIAHPGDVHVVVTIKPKDILKCLKYELNMLANEHRLFKLPWGRLKALNKFLADILKKCKNQFHDADDLAEMLDPFIVEAERNGAKRIFGRQCFRPLPAKQVEHFEPRDPESQDYPEGREPWLAAFLRRWAAAYVFEFGTDEQAFKWGVLAPGQTDGDILDEYWRAKRIIGHRKVGNKWKYRVEWVGKRWPTEEVMAEDLVEQYALVNAYNKAHGLVPLSSKATKAVRLEK